MSQYFIKRLKASIERDRAMQEVRRELMMLAGEIRQLADSIERIIGGEDG